MTDRHLLHRTSWIIAAALLAANFTALSQAHGEDAASLAPTLRRLANSGSFDKLGDLLKTEQESRKDEQVATLLRAVDQYRKHDTDSTAVRRADYQKAYDKMVAQSGEGHVTEAMFNAIEASRLADDMDTMLKDQKVVELVKKTEAKALAAYEKGEWLESLGYYRTLEALFDDSHLHDEQVKKVERHLRVLRFYAPRALEKMYEARAKQLKAERKPVEGEEKKAVPEDDEPIKITGDTWEQRLKDVQLSMYRQTISRAAHQHITSPGYTPLLKGSVEALVTMAATNGLDAAFPKFKNETAVKRFREGLARIRKDLDNLNAALNYLQASEIIDSIVDLNDNTVELPESVIAYELGDGAASQLDDFSSIIWPYDLEQFRRNVDGKFFGVGIQISKRDGRLTVVSPLEGTPAHRAGIRANDIIAKVNGEDTLDWALDRAVREITGPEGTTVKLGIERAGQQNIIEFTLKRAEIVIESIKGWDHAPNGGWTYYIDKASKIGYIRMSQFIPQTKDGMDEAVEAMEKDAGLNALILDLRGNPGGLLSSAIDISDRFVGEGTIVSTVNSQNRETRRYEARADRTYRRFPIIILVNQGSASASEIVSGAIQDYQRGLIIGTRSFGKGSVQDVFPIDNSLAALRLTTQYYRLPAGRIIHRKPGEKVWGIHPDIEVKMTATQVGDLMKYRQDVDIIRDPNDKVDPKADVPTAAKMLERGMDPQLEAALLVLRTGLVAEHVSLAQKGAAAPAGN
ncbi:MAG: S41 family peptidase [Phycisphaeraceae bacterium]